jgi:hypothetical protein
MSLSQRGLGGVSFEIGCQSGHTAERRVALEYAELNWTITMIVSVSTLRILRDHDLAAEALN